MLFAAVLCLALWNGACSNHRQTGPAAQAANEWRALPLISDGKVHPAWFHTGWGTFTVDDGALRTDCDERGLGLLVYGKEKFGDCQIRIVYRSKDPRSNAGVYVRIGEGILAKAGEKTSPARRLEGNRLTDESLEAMKRDSEQEKGPWYAVHHGYEVQICDAADEHHRTGAIYSLASSSAAPPKDPGQWRTMIISLQGTQVLVDLDGQRVTSFDSAASDLPPRKQWHEPKREPSRPVAGYIGLQNHDPGDVVWFREVSVRKL
jgi:hypothetical protein